MATKKRAAKKPAAKKRPASKRKAAPKKFSPAKTPAKKSKAKKAPVKKAPAKTAKSKAAPKRVRRPKPPPARDYRPWTPVIPAVSFDDFRRDAPGYPEDDKDWFDMPDYDLEELADDWEGYVDDDSTSGGRSET